MNMVSRPATLLAPRNIWELYRPDTPLFLTTPAHALLATDAVEGDPNVDMPLASSAAWTSLLQRPVQVSA
ncbi:hypothetical protein [Burkholderia sp. Bp8963]|uniref:hypothetical protein n=1 Tax=Burkholderia sp. Bp8963 TaxID=2184547 RepID=UPI00163AA13B|nr:hypothetical protein [Burkholderia sp. Bp8963]